MNTKEHVLITEFQKRSRYQMLFLVCLVVMLMTAIGIGLSNGVVNIPINKIEDILLEAFNHEMPENLGLYSIVIEVRLVRILTALVVGMSLGVSGLIMQLILQNPMASPFTLGVSSGAGLGAAIAILYPLNFLPVPGEYQIVVCAFFVSTTVSFLILFIARWQGNTPRNLILAGIALMSFFKACTTLLTYFADVYATREIIFWQVGSLGKAEWSSLLIMTIALIIVFPLLVWKADTLNKMALGDEVARSFGVEVKKTRYTLMILVSLLVSVVTSFTGMISFIGLVVPHVMRMIMGSDSRFLIPASALGGGLLLIVADTIALNVISPIILPVGVLTAFIGSPLFVYMIIKQKRRV